MRRAACEVRSPCAIRRAECVRCARSGRPQVRKRRPRRTKERARLPFSTYRQPVKVGHNVIRMVENDVLPRAPRLQIRAPVLIRNSPRAAWKDGWTINISQSGILVAFTSPVEFKGNVEFVVTLSKGALQGPGVALLPDLHCRGQVVRRAPGTDGE